METEKQNHKKTRQELEERKSRDEKGNDTKEVEITPGGLQKKKITAESLSKKAKDERKQTSEFAEKKLPCEKKTTKTKKENKTKKVRRRREELELETEAKIDFLPQVGKLGNNLKSQRILMSEKEKRLLEASNAERSKPDSRKEEVRRLKLRLKERPGRT